VFTVVRGWCENGIKNGYFPHREPGIGVEQRPALNRRRKCDELYRGVENRPFDANHGQGKEKKRGRTESDSEEPSRRKKQRETFGDDAASGQETKKVKITAFGRVAQ